jgi:hypothetical protein
MQRQVTNLPVHQRRGPPAGGGNTSWDSAGRRVHRILPIPCSLRRPAGTHQPDPCPACTCPTAPTSYCPRTSSRWRLSSRCRHRPGHRKCHARETERLGHRPETAESSLVREHSRCHERRDPTHGAVLSLASTLVPLPRARAPGTSRTMAPVEALTFLPYRSYVTTGHRDVGKLLHRRKAAGVKAHTALIPLRSVTASSDQDSSRCLRRHRAVWRRTATGPSSPCTGTGGCCCAPGAVRRDAGVPRDPGGGARADAGGHRPRRSYVTCTGVPASGCLRRRTFVDGVVPEQCSDPADRPGRTYLPG